MVKLPRNAMPVVGGTKFVLRSDVMFETNANVKVENPSCASNVASFLELTTDNVAVEPKVVDIMSSMDHNDDLFYALEDFVDVSVRTFLVPGRANLINMLLDLDVCKEQCDAFLDKCETSLV
jgi:hypothetical protein